MRRLRICFGISMALVGLGMVGDSDRALAADAPDFDEVRVLIRQHLPGATEAELNRLAVEGLLHHLRGKVELIESDETSGGVKSVVAVTQARVFDNHAAYLRVGHLTSTLPAEITRHCEQLAATNQLNGLVLDLRFTSGDDYSVAAATADLFVATERPLLDWGNGVVNSSAKSLAFNWPVVVLVNGETAGAAEALAAVMRESGAALILGLVTRGAAMTRKDFSLKNGDRLRIATVPVKLGDGTPISTDGVKPDIEIKVSAEAERTYWNDPYGTSVRTNLASAGTAAAVTNRPARRTRPNEADLVRARRNGLSLDGEFPVGDDAGPEKPQIRDAALGRAVDLLKGLAVVRRAR